MFQTTNQSCCLGMVILMKPQCSYVAFGPSMPVLCQPWAWLPLPNHLCFLRNNPIPLADNEKTMG